MLHPLLMSLLAAVLGVTSPSAVEPVKQPDPAELVKQVEKVQKAEPAKPTPTVQQVQGRQVDQGEPVDLVDLIENGVRDTAPKAPAGSACGPVVRKADGTPWTCTFVDDFTGSSLNRNKWVVQRTAVSGHSANRADCWVDNPNNISVAGGTLRLTSRKEPAPFVCNHPNRTYKTQYTSGSVSTWGKFAQAFGRWQIRAKFPDVAKTGSHSALWLYPRDQAYGAWPRSGEIDIAEYYSRVPDRVYPVLHYRARGTANGSKSTKNCLVDDPHSFHTYTLEWTTTRIRIWADSTLCIDHVIRPGGRMSAPAPFDQPFATYLTQTLGVGQNRFRDIGRNKTPLPARTEIDWVRVWK